MQKLILTQNNIENQVIKLEIIQTKNIQNCVYKTLEWSFFVPNCDEYKIGSVLEVIGTQQPTSDKNFFQLKSLKVQTVRLLYLGRFSVRRYWGKILNLIDRQKHFLLEEGLKYLPYSVASLVEGMVFGGSSNLPQETQTAFQTTGLTHVVSASGYNVSVIAAVTLAITARVFSRKLSATLVISLVLAYAVAANLGPPIIRSSIMITFNLLASRVFFRQVNPLFSLCLTALIMLFFEPFYAISLSFWLSTLATLGIILVLPLLESQKGVFFQLKTNNFSSQNSLITNNVFQESWLTTLAAQSLTFPLVGMVFGEVSWLSFLTNTALLWLTPLITLSGIGLMISRVVLGLVPGLWQIIGPILSLEVWLPSWLFLSGVGWFGQFVWGVTKWPLPSWATWVWWGMLSIIIIRKWYAKNTSH